MPALKSCCVQKMTMDFGAEAEYDRVMGSKVVTPHIPAIPASTATFNSSLAKTR